MSAQSTGLSKHERNAASTERLVFSVEEAGCLLGLSRNSAYEAVRQHRIPSLRIGRRIVVPKAALLELLARASTTIAASTTTAA